MLFILLCVSLKLASGLEDLDFPAGFKFGVASAAYQVEGAWNVSDKSENIWDRFIREKPDRVSDRSNGEVACDSYHLWRRDIEMVEELGADFYRLSISWSRLLPQGFATYISEDGRKYYNDLIDGLLQKGIEPVVTLYHWDLPQVLQDLGGWTNPLISDWFAEYSRVVFSLYADRVNTWITINEPLIVCDLPYNTGILAPGIKDTEVAPYLCNKHVLMAHAKAWRIYDQEFRSKYNGRISITNHAMWFEAFTPEDEDVAELVRQNMVGRYSHAIYSKEGGWPPAIEKVLEKKASNQGYSETNLPAFTKQEIEFVKGTYDFFGLNHYTSRLVRRAEDGEALRSWPMGDAPDIGAKCFKSEEWKTTSSSWFFEYPEGFRKLLVWLKKTYGDIEIFITENGFANKGGLEDQDRIDYYRDYLKQVLLAIKEDKVNVTGYTAWTLMDNFEWMDGYQSKFGLYEVDFSSLNRTRTPRASASYYSKIAKTKSLNIDINNAKSFE